MAGAWLGTNVHVAAGVGRMVSIAQAVSYRLYEANNGGFREFKDPRDAALAFVLAPVSDKPSVVRLGRGDGVGAMREPGVVIAYSSSVGTAGSATLWFWKTVSDLDMDFKETYDRLVSHRSAVCGSIQNKPTPGGNDART